MVREEDEDASGISSGVDSWMEIVGGLFTFFFFLEIGGGVLTMEVGVSARPSRAEVEAVGWSSI